MPVGFTGTVRLVLDPAGQDIPLVDGRYRIVVPSDGQARFRSLHPLEHWHTLTARYTDGTPIPRDHDDGMVSPDTVAVRGGQSSVSRDGDREYRSQTYFVGTTGQRTDVPPPMDIPAAAK